MSIRTNDKWEALSRDLDAAELAESVSESKRVAEELRQHANGLAATAMDSAAGAERDKKLRNAVSMYRRACATLIEAAPQSGAAPSASSSLDVQQSREILLACKLNAGCLMLALGDTKDAWSLCLEVLALDKSNPGAARLAAELAARSGQVDEEAKWLHHASQWSKARGDKQQLESASCALAKLDPKKVVSARSARELCTQFEQAMAQFKKSDLESARRQLLQVWGLAKGELESNAADKAVRAVAFNTLEGLMEVEGRAGALKEAERYGREALQLLHDTAGGEFLTEEAKPRREGLLLLSLGFLVQPSSTDDAKELWRRAAAALKSCSGEQLAEVQALLALGTATADRIRMQSGEVLDADDIQEAVDALERSISLCSEHRQKASKASDTETGTKRIDTAHLEMRAWVAVTQLLVASGERDEATRCLESSASLMDLLPSDVPVPEVWAEVCGDWALLAARLTLPDQADRALQCQRDIGQFVGDNRIQCEALKSLAVVRQQRKDAAGALEALEAAQALEGNPDGESSATIAQLRERLGDMAASAAEAASESGSGGTVGKAKKDSSTTTQDPESLREMPFPWELILVALLLLGCGIAKLLGYQLSELGAHLGLDFLEL